MGYMIYGGIQKSLVSFLDAVKDKVDVDVLLWGRTENEIELPTWVNILNVPTVKSVRKAKEENGLFSPSFILSCLGLLNKKRWKVMPKLKKHYDVAIAYPQVGFPKYYVIDKVNADKKYAFYHHGSYEFSDVVKAWDKEYYPKYDKLYCVSKHTQNILEEALAVDINYDIMPNYLNVERIYNEGQVACAELENAKGIKILTVARLSEEKNISKCLDVCKKLVDDGVEFSYNIVGDGVLRATLENEIIEKGLSSNVFLLGGQPNPYKFMNSCDVYLQLSKFEADPITIKEAGVFSKPMVLSDIVAFKNATSWINNITLSDSVNDIANAIKNVKKIEIIKNDFSRANETFFEKLAEIFEF